MGRDTMKAFAAIYKGNRVLELCDDASVFEWLAEDSEVLVVVPEEQESEDEAWSKFALEQFFGGYSEADSAYNSL